MGVTVVELRVRKSADATESRTVECTVDTGATASVLPGELLREIGVSPVDQQHYRLADGSRISRERGWAYVELEGRGAYARVVFGEEGDGTLLGVMTLEELELFVDPLHRELHQLEQRL